MWFSLMPTAINCYFQKLVLISMVSLTQSVNVQSDRCKECREPREAHFYYYAHHSKQLTIRVKQLGKEPPLPGKSEGRLWMWSRCGKCEPSQKVETKRVLISSAARGLSFGKFLELSLSSHSSFNRLSSCGHSFQKDFLYFFGYECLAYRIIIFSPIRAP